MASPSTTATLDYSQLLPKGQIEATVKEWLDDDMPSFDIGGFVVGSDVKSARLLLKSSGVFCGKPFMEAVFHLLHCNIEWKEEAIEGTVFEISSSEPLCLAIVTGPVNALLRGERTALNTLSRCSGVATASRQACAIASSCNWNGHVAGTRKTTPGFRIAEKYGLLVGGASTHRLDLSQMTMLKDNHIWSAGSISAAVALAKRAAGFSSKIEVECQSLQEAVEAAHAGADIVMLDNFEPNRLKQDSATFKQQFPHVLVEASGGITIETMGDYLSEHVDIVSQGKLTQGYDCLDYSLKIIP